VTSGQFTFNISQMTGYLGNGTAAVATPIVFVGEAVAGASTITSTVAYAYNGMYTSPLQAIPSSSSSLSLNHNLGISPQGYTSVCTYVNVTSNLGYSAGEELSCDTVTNNNTSFAYMQMDNSSRLLTELSSQSSGFASIIPKGGGSTSSATAADWNVRLYVRRNF
jgi:hypothetical protein